MKKALFAIVLFISTTLAVKAQQPTTSQINDNPNAPEISFENETLDYGTIEYNSNGEREFKFKNTGTVCGTPSRGLKPKFGGCP